MLRVLVSLAVLAVMWFLVKLQINAADHTRWLTVEQLVSRNRSGLSLDRHYAAIALDPSIIAPFISLCIFLRAPQWKWQEIALVGVVVVILSVLAVWFWSTLPAEAHNQSAAGIYHGIFLWIALTVFVLVLLTPRPEPVLMLCMCIALPAFLFAGNHMILGLINYSGAASTYHDHPLQNWIGWFIILFSFLVAAWRSYMVIPDAFWTNLG